MKCMAKVVAMPGTRTAVADLCMFGLAACDERGPGFVNVSVRSWSAAAEQMRVKGEQSGSWVRQVAQAMEEQLKEDQQELETRERKRKMEDVERIRRTVRENNKTET